MENKNYCVMDFSILLNSPSTFSTVRTVRSISAPRLTPVDHEKRSIKNLEQANEHILKKTSVNDNLRSIYVPLMLVRNSMLILGAVREALAKTIKVDRSVFDKYGKTRATEELLRSAKYNLDSYEHQLHQEMDDQRITLEYSSEDFYEIMLKTYTTLQGYAEAELREACPLSDDNTITLVACCHLVKMLLDYKDAFELECCKRMQDCLKGTTLKIRQKNPIWHDRLKKHAIQIIELLEMPTELTSDMVKLYRKVMADKIEKIDMVKLTDDAVHRRVEVMNL